MPAPFPIDVHEIPTTPEATVENLQAMRAFATEVLGTDLGDGDVRFACNGILTHTVRQLDLLARVLHDESELVAWATRNLFELLIWSRYALASRQRVLDFMLLWVKDYNDLDHSWFGKDGFEPQGNVEEAFRTSVAAMRGVLSEKGQAIPKGRPPSMETMAADVGAQDLYRAAYRLLSKYVHPTPLLILSRDKPFMHGPEARETIRVFAQHCAALLLSELPERIASLRAADVGGR